MTTATQTARTAKARREVQKELSNAIANGLTQGTVVTTVGVWTPFTVKYIQTSARLITEITIKGYVSRNVNDAASAALYVWGMTRG